MPAHVHAENMRLYYDDALETEEPWLRWEFRCKGMKNYEQLQGAALWEQDGEYRRIPKLAPTITINGITFPEPVRDLLEKRQEYWVACSDFGIARSRWEGDETDFERLADGLIQLTEEGAKLQREAMLSMVRKQGGDNERS